MRRSSLTFSSALDDSDIQILKTYVSRSQIVRYPKLIQRQGQGPYAAELKKIESDIKEIQKRVNEKMGMIFTSIPSQCDVMLIYFHD